MTKYPVGEMTEGLPWEIEANFRVEYAFGQPCKHCVDIVDVSQHQRSWTVPRVVVADNEGGYNCTAVCVDCILEALDTAPKSDSSLPPQ